jgi:hypothetical protein
MLKKWVTEIFQYQGIKLTDNLTLGKATNALSSDKLSSGEKQMLSFLCYNAFYNQGIIFIDEPLLPHILLLFILNFLTKNSYWTFITSKPCFSLAMYDTKILI